MSHDNSNHFMVGQKQSWAIKMNFLEWVMIGALLVTLGLTSLDALEGRHLGTSDALSIAKLQGQQGMVASVSK